MILHVIHASAHAEDGLLHNATYAISDDVVEHDLPMVLPNVVDILTMQVTRSARQPARCLCWEVHVFNNPRGTAS